MWVLLLRNALVCEARHSFEDQRYIEHCSCMLRTCKENLTDFFGCLQVATSLPGLETVSCPEHPGLSTAFTLHERDAVLRD